MALYDEDSISVNYKKYFKEAISRYPSSPYEEYKVDLSDLASLDTKLNEYVNYDVVCFLSQTTVTAINSNIIAVNLNVYYTPTINEMKDLSSSSSSSSATLYHLLPVIESQDEYMKNFARDVLHVTKMSNKFYQTYIIYLYIFIFIYINSK